MWKNQTLHNKVHTCNSDAVSLLPQGKLAVCVRSGFIKDMRLKLQLSSCLVHLLWKPKHALTLNTAEICFFKALAGSRMTDNKCNKGRRRELEMIDLSLQQQQTV